MSPLYRRIGSYEIRGEIGGGGMADVYVAEDSRTGARVALKVPRRDPEIRRAERDGALLQQHLAERDPRVARVFETGEDEGVSFVAMEYVEGQDLSERIALGPLDPREAIRIAIELCDLLATAHACTPSVNGQMRRGIVHGDLKPRNIRLEPAGRVRVVDFGIAKALSETRKLTHNEFGSLLYSSPERVGSGVVDAHADVWAVAVVLYEMVAGQTPFRAATPRQLEQLILSRVPPATLPASSPRELDAVLRKALAPDLACRYANAAGLKSDLEALMRGETPRAAHERDSLETTRRTGTAAGGVPPAGGGAEDIQTRRTWNGTVDDSTRRSGPVRAGGEATHRTNGDPTRRTAVPATMSAAAVPATTATPAQAVSAKPKLWSRLKPTLLRVLVIAAVALGVNELLVSNDAKLLASELSSFRRPDANTAWHRYLALRKRSLLGFGLWPVREPLENWFISAADELTSDYLSDTPTIRERGWLQAAALLSRAGAVAPGDAKVRARRRYVDGQLARIDAEALLERKAAGMSGKFNEARHAFEDAARLRRDWPDPHLGLARVAAIGFADVERTSDALDAAESAGYKPGDRETALLADAHRLRAQRLWRSIPKLPEPDRTLQQVRHHCEQALQLYEKVPAYGQVSRSIWEVRTLLQQVELKEQDLRLWWWPFRVHPEFASPPPGGPSGQ